MNKKTVAVRSAQWEDLDAMVSLLQTLFAVEKDFTPDLKRQRKGLVRFLDGCGKHRCIKVAEVEGDVVGMCTAQTLVSTAEGGMVALIEDMVVDSRYREMGIGRSLMESIEKWAHDRRATRLQLLADRTNFGALDFYAKIGWLPTRLICLRRKFNEVITE
jgi:GNAT superfamily N-acetyltransferase